ncbi:MAG: PTS system, fructose-specific IIABC component [Candidatus Carbobacillus altaicus]|uniref:PTS system, fructose-specific IIABC component n=1 Tax=Candidatus Carbonibacillus altaicus TaxID=2163959 RepID=A0A2R6Y3X9_9BACL|nr:MAG: PTS system, fructose-specific IIABC component [Candidatus Carbobacillus altaicus]
MNLRPFLKDEVIWLDADCPSREKCIEGLAERLEQAGSLENKDHFISAVWKREKEGTTALGFDLAIPHGKSDSVKKAGVAFTRLKKPINWHENTGEEASYVSIVFLLAIPDKEADTTHLEMLSEIARRLMDEGVRARLLQASSTEEVRQVFDSGD